MNDADRRPTLTPIEVPIGDLPVTPPGGTPTELKQPLPPKRPIAADAALTFWERVRMAGHIIMKPDITDLTYGAQKMEQKHDWKSTVAGLIPAILLIVGQEVDLPDGWMTYITAAGLLGLGILSNSWGNFIKYLPALAERVFGDIAARRKNSNGTDPTQPSK